MSPDKEKERQEALAALERLYRRGILDLQEASTAARLISGDDNYSFPPPAAPTEDQPVAAEKPKQPVPQ